LCRASCGGQTRYYDYPVADEKKRVEKLQYMHFNPVKRGLAKRPEDWKWSSFLAVTTGHEGTVEIESRWTARKRERAGKVLRVARSQEQPHPVAPNPGATRVGQPRK
jgi:putative transposase